MKNLLISLISIHLITIGCSKKTEQNLDYVPETAEVEMDMAAAPSASWEATDYKSKSQKIVVEKREQKIIKTASIRFQVEDFKKSSVTIKRISNNFGALNTSYNENNNGYNIEATFVARITNAKFDTLLTALQIESIYLNYKNINTVDVTEEFVDIEARLKNKIAVEKKYLEILKKAVKIVDILAVEEQIRIIREEIEAKEGRMKYLKDQVAFSTINLTFYQTLEGIQAPDIGFWSKSKTAFTDGWNSILSFGLWLLGIWPYLILIFAGFYFGRKWWLKK